MRGRLRTRCSPQAGRLRTQYLLAGGDACVPGQALLVLCSWATPSLLLHYFFTTPSLLFHYSFATTRPSLILRSTFARPSLILRPHLLEGRRGRLVVAAGMLAHTVMSAGEYKKSVNSLDVVPATEALALPINLETTTRSPRRYNKRG